LENLGAGFLNCDKLAHSVYTKGQTCYEPIVQQFGKKILDDDGEINRKALGAIVFNSKVLKLAYCRQTDSLSRILGKLVVALLIKKFLILYGTQRYHL
jgi:dephospho-CoA kinase